MRKLRTLKTVGLTRRLQPRRCMIAAAASCSYEERCHEDLAAIENRAESAATSKAYTIPFNTIVIE